MTIVVYLSFVIAYNYNKRLNLVFKEENLRANYTSFPKCRCHGGTCNKRGFPQVKKHLITRKRASHERSKEELVSRDAESVVYSAEFLELLSNTAT